MIRLTVLFCLLFAFSTSAQRLHVGIFGGLAAYNGELAEKPFPKKVTNGAIGITASYEVTEKLLVRAGYTYAIVGGADRYSDKPTSIARNLAFETKLSEFSLIAEYNIYSLYEKRFTPYLMAGIAAFHFNPYAFNGTTEKIFLKPLSTEGQGLAGYPDRKPYSLIQPALPLGGGLKFAVNEKINIALEVGVRFTLTDYLDDVSMSYVDPNDLLAARGQLAVDMSYRGDELPNGDPNYPTKGFQRGGDNIKDIYYFSGLHLTYRLGDAGGIFRGGSNSYRKSRFGCPSNIY
jgi:opacity protein-like surface antigen